MYFVSVLILGARSSSLIVSLLWTGRVFWFVCSEAWVIEKLTGELHFLAFPGKKCNMLQVTIWLFLTATSLNHYTFLLMLPRQEPTRSNPAGGHECTEILMAGRCREYIKSCLCGKTEIIRKSSAEAGAPWGLFSFFKEKWGGLGDDFFCSM